MLKVYLLGLLICSIARSIPLNQFFIKFAQLFDSRKIKPIAEDEDETDDVEVKSGPIFQINRSLEN